jgi:histidine ammonia-lyase
MTAARNARQILANTMHVLAIELYTAARALDLRLRDRPQSILGKGTEDVYSQIRKTVPYRPGDAWWGPEIEKVRRMIAERALKVDNATLSRYL